MLWKNLYFGKRDAKSHIYHECAKIMKVIWLNKLVEVLQKNYKTNKQKNLFIKKKSLTNTFYF